IDDVFGELDPRRRNALMNLLPADTQKLVTTTNLDWWDRRGLELGVTTVKDGELLEE
ncbi:MAG TPA: DNA replication and repair protein RecF, partial [Verrucomicrobiales bacterium]|nr:DNA replication and repair protein RecF [Verrucomicrobiales bacterium]